MKREKDPNLGPLHDTIEDGSLHQLLLRAINQGVSQRLQTVAAICASNPELTVEAIQEQMEVLANQQLPEIQRQDFWTSRMDQILLRGASGGVASARKAANRILSMYPDVRLEMIQQRQRLLARRVSPGKTLARRKYEWTENLDELLQKVHEHSGFGEAVAEVQKLTGWPRAAVYRRSHRLGIPKERGQNQRRWSAVDWKYASDRLSHYSVSTIAKALQRSVKSVRRKVEAEGYKVRVEDDYTISKLARDLHVRPQTFREWIREGKLKRGRNKRVKEAVLRQFLKEHGHLFDLDVVEPDMRLILLECRSPNQDRLSAAAS